jgi:hypothetical protein
MKKEPERWERFERTRKEKLLETIEVDLGELEPTHEFVVSIDFLEPIFGIEKKLKYEVEANFDIDVAIADAFKEVRKADKENLVKNIIIKYEIEDEPTEYRRVIIDKNHYKCSRPLNVGKWSCEYIYTEPHPYEKEEDIEKVTKRDRAKLDDLLRRPE